MNYWLIKSEPNSYSIEDLEKDKVTAWTGIRNYQARNFMKSMKRGDMILFYHSSSKPMGVFGVASIAKEAYPDPTQFIKKDWHFDPKATKAKPIWHCVDIKFMKKLKRAVTLDEMKFRPELEGMMLRNRSRLSVQPVSKDHFNHILKLGK